MLQQILKDMYIDPELLEELSEEQKQILFMKMREEQIRRYEEAEYGPPRRAATDKKVSFKMDARNEPWTWVMGEAEGDLSYEQMVAVAIEREQQEQKRKDEEDARRAKELAEEQLKEETRKAETAREERRRTRQRLLSDEHERLKKEQQEFELSLKQQENIYKNTTEARLAVQRAEEEKKRRESLRLEEERKLKERLQAEEERDRQEQKAEQERLKMEAQKRSEEIYVNMRTLRLQKEAEEQKREEAEWKMQQEKAKAFDKEREVSFHRAKEHRMRKVPEAESANDQLPGDVLQRMRELSRTSHEQPPETIATRQGTPPSVPRTARPGTGTLPRDTKNSTRPVVMGTGSLPRLPAPREARPANRAAVIQWFKEVEWPRRVMCTPQGTICPWFHGILSRASAEHLLEGKPNGTFLIRVSERIWGYTVSVSSAHRIKHFLIDAAMPGRYQFFGENQKSHPDLHSLIDFHRKYPISVAGQELLMNPQSQVSQRPDYNELFS